LSGLKHIS